MIAALMLFQAGGGAAGILGSPFAMLAIVMGVFYFVLFMPQQRQRKRTEQMLAALKTGDKVITGSGIYGTINAIDGDAVILKISAEPPVKIRVTRSAIAQVEASEDAK
jgi:preprotein translocase subunit YajC